jgi:hypothetical protein
MAEILPTASRRVRGCAGREQVTPTMTQTARRTRQSVSPNPHCPRNLLLEVGTPVETAGRNLIQEAGERPHLLVFRGHRSMSVQTLNSLLQKLTQTHILTRGVKQSQTRTVDIVVLTS